ncbi:membrane integrity-associated transporter subunit PqiC [Stutzerimonas zhaodongensis]|uniref:PqiC family protein n=1 Tax=Stutzerimonas zhaodongensis TaxID=1176257 RepID=UPI0039F0119F
MQRFTTILLFACVSLAGCVTQPVPMYRLDNGNVEMPAQAADGAAILLGPIELADYLRQDALLQRQPDGSLAANGQQARWAGDLQGDINQLLLRQLASRLKTQSLELSPGSNGFSPDVQIELEITRLDSGPQHPAVLEAHWRLLDKQGKRQGSRLVRLQEDHRGSATDQVRAQSVLLHRLSGMLASAVEPIVVAKTQAKRNIVKAPSKPASPPTIPAVEPIRTEMEVFRF